MYDLDIICHVPTMMTFPRSHTIIMIVCVYSSPFILMVAVKLLPCIMTEEGAMMVSKILFIISCCDVYVSAPLNHSQSHSRDTYYIEYKEFQCPEDDVIRYQ